MDTWRTTPRRTKCTYHHALGVDGPAGRALPVLVVRGCEDGPTLVTFAGVHGDEYEPMAAVQRVFAQAEPESLTGTWVAVACCNVDAFLAGGREGPEDGKNLARVFPGRADGTLTERVAYCLTHDFISKASFVCDLHSGGRVYRMLPMAGYMLSSPSMTAVQRRAAQAFGLPFVWGTAPEPGRSLSAAADWGVPAIYCETTGTGGCREQDVEAYARGTFRLMTHLGMLPGEAKPPPGQRVLEDPTPSSGHLQVKNTTPVDGLFLTSLELGSRVERGDVLGRVVDSFGRVRFECRTDTAGEIILLRHLSRVVAGDALAVVVPV